MLVAIQHHVDAVLARLVDTGDRPFSLHYTLSRADLRIYSQKVIWEDIRRLMQKLKSSQNYQWIESKHNPEVLNTVYISQMFLACRFRSSWYLLDYEQVMMVADTIASRTFTVLYHSMLSDHTPGKLDTDLLMKVYTVYDNLLIESGNNSYQQIKYWEPICLSILLHKHDGLSNDNDFYNYIKQDLQTNKFESASFLLNLLIKEPLTANQLSELHGMYRHWGHPTVDEVKGCEKVRKFATSRPVPDYSVLYKIRGLMKRPVSPF